MKFEQLKDRMEYYKGIADYRLMPNSYVLAHVDGRSFSKKIKKFFHLPFDKAFMDMMNESAIYACKNIQGCKMAYVQSDEITFIITDFDELNTDSFFGFRLCKMQSIIASLVTCKFQQLFIEMLTTSILDDHAFEDKYLFQFDCKCWTVPSYNDAFAWIKYRQNDCIRNSKQQAAQTYCSYKELLRKNTDEQIEFLKEKANIDWNNYSNGEKYGRLIFKETELHQTDGKKKGEVISYERSVWKAHEYGQLTRETFDNLAVVPKKDEDRI